MAKRSRARDVYPRRHVIHLDTTTDNDPFICSQNAHTALLTTVPSDRDGIVIGTILCTESVGAAEAVSWAIGHNPGRVATPTQDTRMAQLSQQAGTQFADLGRMTG